MYTYYYIHTCSVRECECGASTRACLRACTGAGAGACACCISAHAFMYDLRARVSPTVGRGREGFFGNSTGVTSLASEYDAKFHTRTHMQMSVSFHVRLSCDTFNVDSARHSP